MAADKNLAQSKQCVTPQFRVSFPALFQAKAFGTHEPKFSVVMLFDKRTDISAMKKAATAAAVEKWGADQKKWPKPFKWPFRDGDEERSETEGYKNCTFVSATSKQRPGVVDRQKLPITEASEVYAGCSARAYLQAYAFDTQGNRGVAFGLQHIQKLGDGEAFSGRKNVDDAFDEVKDDSENPSFYDEKSSANSDSDFSFEQGNGMTVEMFLKLKSYFFNNLLEELGEIDRKFLHEVFTQMDFEAVSLQTEEHLRRIYARVFSA